MVKKHMRGKQFDHLTQEVSWNFNAHTHLCTTQRVMLCLACNVLCMQRICRQSSFSATRHSRWTDLTPPPQWGAPPTLGRHQKGTHQSLHQEVKLISHPHHLNHHVVTAARNGCEKQKKHIIRQSQAAVLTERERVRMLSSNVQEWRRFSEVLNQMQV